VRKASSRGALLSLGRWALVVELISLFKNRRYPVHLPKLYRLSGRARGAGEVELRRSDLVADLTAGGAFAVDHSLASGWRLGDQHVPVRHVDMADGVSAVGHRKDTGSNDFICDWSSRPTRPIRQRVPWFPEWMGY